MAKTLDDRINDFEEKLKKLKEQKKLAENRAKKKAKEQERKDDTRRKILLGSMYFQKMKEDEQYKLRILEALDRYLTEDRDRKLFGLALLSEENPSLTSADSDSESEPRSDGWN